MSELEILPQMQDHINKTIRSQVSKFYRDIEDTVRVKLSDRGFIFDTKESFYQFFSERVSCIQYGEYIKEFRLDYSNKSKGTILVRWSDEIKFNVGYNTDVRH